MRLYFFLRFFMKKVVVVEEFLSVGTDGLIFLNVDKHSH